jgi:hypothetical protein
MSKAEFIEKVANKGKMSKAEASRTVDLVFGEIESSLKAAKKNGGAPPAWAAIRRPASRSRSRHPRACASSRPAT